MQSLSSYLLGNVYSGFSPAMNIASAVCNVNGQVVACPSGLDSIMGGFFFLEILLIVLMIVSLWKVYTKANQPGWAAIIPIYNMIVLLKMIGRPVWWIILMFVPFVNIIVGLVVTYDLSKAFGKGIGYTLGLIFLPFIFYPVLAFGDASYMSSGMAHPARQNF